MAEKGKTPVVRDTTLTWFDEYTGQDVTMLDIGDDWQRWQEWLDQDTTKAFRYVRIDGAAVSVVKELRAHFGNRDDKRPVWYAHKRFGKKLKKKYLGKSANLTRQKLSSVAFELAQRDLF